MDVDPVLPLLLAARWVHFAAVFALFGAPLFFVYAVPGGAKAGVAALPRTAALTGRAMRVAAFVAAASGLCWLLASMVLIAGDPPSAREPEFLALFFSTPFGVADLLRLALLGGVVLIATVPMREARRLTVLAIAAACLLVSQAWLGHAAEGGLTGGGAVMIACYAAHVLGGAAWLGGLLPFFWALRERSEVARPAGADGFARRLALRFSFAASLAVGMVVLSGIANVAFHAGLDLRGLVASRWGQVLCVKLALFAVALAFAGMNRFVLVPQLARTGVHPWLRASAASEIVCGVLLIASAAALGMTPPPR